MAKTENGAVAGTAAGTVVTTQAGQNILLQAANTDLVVFTQDGSDLIVTAISDGSKIVLEGFFSQAATELPPQLTLSNGTVITAAEVTGLVEEFDPNQVAPAAGPQGGGGAAFGEYGDEGIGDGLGISGLLDPTDLGFPEDTTVEDILGIPALAIVDPSQPDLLLNEIGLGAVNDDMAEESEAIRDLMARSGDNALDFVELRNPTDTDQSTGGNEGVNSEGVLTLSIIGPDGDPVSFDVPNVTIPAGGRLVILQAAGEGGVETIYVVYDAAGVEQSSGAVPDADTAWPLGDDTTDAAGVLVTWSLDGSVGELDIFLANGAAFEPAVLNDTWEGVSITSFAISGVGDDGTFNGQVATQEVIAPGIFDAFAPISSAALVECSPLGEAFFLPIAVNNIFARVDNFDGNTAADWTTGQTPTIGSANDINDPNPQDPFNDDMNPGQATGPAAAAGEDTDTDGQNVIVVGTNEGEFTDGEGIVRGGNAQDFLIGGEGNDVMDGDAHNDFLYGGAGNDILDGSSGGDFLLDDDGRDILVGGTGTDILFGRTEAGEDVMYGGEGNDFIPTKLAVMHDGRGEEGDEVGNEDGAFEYGTGDLLIGDEIMEGGFGNDFMQGGKDNDRPVRMDVMEGGFGNDTMDGVDDERQTYMRDIIVAGDGSDIIYGDNAGLEPGFTPDDIDNLYNDIMFQKYISGAYGFAYAYRNYVEWNYGGADLIYGGWGDDIIFGQGGDDAILAGHGRDLVAGGSGADKIRGNGGNDSLYGDSGNDTIYGDGGRDFMQGNEDDDLMYGGAGNDYMSGGSGNDIMYGDAEGDQMFGDSGDDLMYGGSGADTMYGGSGNDLMYGGADNDQMVGDSGNDVMYGGDANDTMDGNSGNDSLYGGADDDLLHGNSGEDSLSGGAGDDDIYGDDDNDTLEGNSGNDDLKGGGGDDLMYGGTGNDFIEGQDDNDTMYGGADNDLMFGGAGDDLMYGDQGDDQMFGNDGVDTMYGGSGSVDRMDGGADNDLMHGDNGDNAAIGDDDTMHGGEGDDTMFGEGGDDVMYGDTGSPIMVGPSGPVNVDKDGSNNSQATAQNLDGNFGVLLDPNVENSGTIPHVSVTATGNGSFDWYSFTVTQNGSDVILDIDFGDNVGGDIDTELFLYDSAGNLVTNNDDDSTDPGSEAGPWDARISTNLAAGLYYLAVGEFNSSDGPGSFNPTGGVPDAGDTYTLHVSVENHIVTGGEGTYNDLMYGGAGDDTMFGEAGDDVMFGGAGNDIMEGNDGTDTMFGGSGSADTLSGNDDDDLMYGDNGDDALVGDDDVMFGGQGNDVMYGEGGADTMRGGANNDVMFGGAGNDLMFGEDGNDSMYGGADNDNLSGGDGDDLMYGGAGNDTMFGEIGDDRMSGNSGDDLMYGDEGDDTLLGEDGMDVMFGGSGNDVMAGNDADDVMDGGSGNDVMSGDQGNDRVEGGSGDDLMYGGAGNDSMFGEIGDDNMSGGTGNDEMHGGAGNDSMFGEIGDDNMSGGFGNDYMEGGSGNDTLDGGFDDDIMYGGANNDILNGGFDDDVMYGGSGDDTLSGSFDNDTLTGGSGSDSVSGGFDNDVLIWTMADNAGAADIYNGDGDTDTLELYFTAAEFVAHEAAIAEFSNRLENGEDNVVLNVDGRTLTASNIEYVAVHVDGLEVPVLIDDVINTHEDSDVTATITATLATPEQDFIPNDAGSPTTFHTPSAVTLTPAGATPIVFVATDWSQVGNIWTLALMDGADDYGSLIFDATDPENVQVTLDIPEGVTIYDLMNTGDQTTVQFDYSGTVEGIEDATVLINVNGTNDGPVAEDDIVITNVAGEILVPQYAMLVNDTDIDDDELFVDSVDASAALAGDYVSYDVQAEPASSYEYDVSDGVATDTGEVFVTYQDSLYLEGGNANEIIIGGDGADTILGGAGDDTIIGGKGDDAYDAGSGEDTIHFYSVEDGNDKVFGFDTSEDTINLDALFDELGVAAPEDRADLINLQFVNGITNGTVITIDGQDDFSVKLVDIDIGDHDGDLTAQELLDQKGIIVSDES